MKYKTLKILKEMDEYINPENHDELLNDWFKNNVYIKNPLFIFDVHPNGIVYVRKKDSGISFGKFKITALENKDEDLDIFNDDLAEDEEQISDDSVNMNQLGNLASVADNSENLKKIGLNVGDNAKKALGMYQQAIDSTISKTQEIAKKILDQNRNN